ncbi:helix-turn-helix transcriptional regulator [Leuconostoc gelidum subsp. gelidum]|uniref:helix-turn-helix domain-containing protein n=1 Tax=Leuconostoc gelidum TaxID=1244 RepID=UPI001CC514CD|nr:helix-turn-helix transcriptional regulator [Leuconostoc gelidum]MBZ6014699.1 helix-turn-helix transcriptional regulator [Leuconostoc gelidum subsp. gelidum]
MDNKIKQLRNENKLSVRALSEELNKVGVEITPATISRYENGDREPKLEMWEILADFFKVSVPFLQGLNYPKTDEEFYQKLNQHTNFLLEHYSSSDNDEYYHQWSVYLVSLYEQSKVDEKIYEVNNLITSLSLITNEIILGLPISKGRSGVDEGIRLLENTIQTLREKKNVVYGPNGIEYFSDDDFKNKPINKSSTQENTH